MTITKVQKKVSKPFHKSDVSIVSSDFTGSESYWTATGSQVLTTVVGVDYPTAQIRYNSTYVDSTQFQFDIEFPDLDEWFAGDMFVESYYANITRREIHIFEKTAGTPTRYRIDAYDGTTLLCQYYVFQDQTDNKVFKYGLRIRHVEVPTSFSLDYDFSDDSQFAETGIVFSGEVQDNTSDPADVVGKTFYFSFPTAYLPEGKALLGGASDNSARLLAFAAVVLAVGGIAYTLMSQPAKK